MKQPLTELARAAALLCTLLASAGCRQSPAPSPPAQAAAVAGAHDRDLRQVTQVSASADAQHFAVLLGDGNLNQVLIFAANHGVKPAASIDLPALPREIALSPDGSIVAVGYGAPKYGISLFDAATGRAMSTHLQDEPSQDLDLSKADVHGLAFTSDSKRLLALVDDGYAAWQLPAGTLAFQYATPDADTSGDADAAFGIAASTDGTLLTLTRPSKTYVLGLKPAAVRYRFTLRTGGVAQFSPDSRTIAAPAENGRDTNLWNAQTGRLSQTLKNCGQQVAFAQAQLVCLSASDVRIQTLGADPSPTRAVPLRPHAQLIQAGRHALLYAPVLDGAWAEPSQMYTLPVMELDTGLMIKLALPGRVH